MVVAIKDKYSKVPSKQMRYQLRKQAKGLCRRCAKPRTEMSGVYCDGCLGKVKGKYFAKTTPAK